MISTARNATEPLRLNRSLSAGEPPTYGRGTGVPDPFDVYVGSRVRARRMLLGMKQERLAQALGVTFQQVQKYESGANRISASRLWDIAEVLSVPVGYFFPDPSQADGPADGGPTLGGQGAREHMLRPETIELIRLYYAIADPQLRQQLLDMLKAVSGSQQAPRKS